MKTEDADPLADYFAMVEMWGRRQTITGEVAGYDPVAYLLDELARGRPEIARAIEVRQQLLTNEERNFANSLVDGGGLAGYSPDMTASILVASREMDRFRRDLDLSRTLDRYTPNDPLLSTSPPIASRTSKRREMISLSQITQIGRSGLFMDDRGDPDSHGAGMKLTTWLDPELVNFVLKHTKNGALEVRLDPDYPSASADPPMATRTQELPSHASSTLDGVPLERLLLNRTIRISRPVSIDEDPIAALDYYSSGLRSLDIAASFASDRTELYFEELVDLSHLQIDPVTQEIIVDEDGALIGRMIHCDTDAGRDALCNAIELFHLDLAINVYRGRRKQERLARDLTTRVEAERRIHILKASPIPLNLLPGIAFLYLTRSRRQLLRHFQEVLG